MMEPKDQQSLAAGQAERRRTAGRVARSKRPVGRLPALTVTVRAVQLEPSSDYPKRVSLRLMRAPVPIAAVDSAFCKLPL